MIRSDIFSFCLRRSGHTAIMNWIASQVQPSHSFKDCNMTNNKLSTPVVHIFRNNKLESQIHKKESGLQYKNKKQRLHCLKEYELTLCAFEDGSTINFGTNSIRNIVKQYRIVDNPKIVIVMRDPFNLFASRVWRNRNHLEVPYNRRAADWFNMQLHQFETEGDFIFIDYYQWITSISCREHIAKMLGIPFITDKFFRKQANISSFNNFNAEAVKLGFNNRWQEFITEANDGQKQEYLELLNKIDMDLCCRYFMHMDCREIYKEIKGLI